MCDPAAMFVVSLASKALSFAQQASAERSARKQELEARRRTAAQKQLEAIASYGDIQAEAVADQRQTSEEQAEIARESLRRRSNATVKRGEAGVTGLSVEGLQRDLAGRAARDGQASSSALRSRAVKRERRKDQVQLTLQGHLDHLNRPLKPSNIGWSAAKTGLNIAQDIGRFASSNA